MDEHKKIRKQLIKNMLVNLILLTLLYGTFSFFILGQFNRYLYETVDSEINQSRQNISNISKMKQEWIDQEFFQKELSEQELVQEIENDIIKLGNPRIVTILRKDNGEVIATSPSLKYFANYIDQNEFPKIKNDEIYELKVMSDNTNYYYRGTTVNIVASNNKNYIIEIMINTNSEKQMLLNFTKTLSIGSLIIISLSIIISWLLSKRAVDPLIESYKKQTEFVQNASHELRTPLTIIQAKQELLLQSPNCKIIDKSEEIALSLNETRRLSKMITELMELARSDNGQSVIHKTDTNLDTLSKEVIIPYQEMAEIQNKKMNLTVSCDRTFNIDKNKIKQLLIILLDNALKYTEENDEIELEIKNHDEKLFINVKDTGIGISDEALKHIFERFYREDKARSRQKGGTGLGLSIAQTIVKKHGGTIKLVHNKPKGTLVIIKI